MEQGTINDLKANILAPSVTITVLDRGCSNLSFEIDSAAQREVKLNMQHLDTLKELVEEIVNHFRTPLLVGFMPCRGVQ
ncbi:MAG: hypothetical protein RMJ88_07495 [Thermogemmata sp.]|nr:hypothetical protein [Thermogemmata sp.]